MEGNVTCLVVGRQCNMRAHQYDEIPIHTCSILTPHREQDESSSSFIMSAPRVRNTLTPKLSEKSHSGQDQLTPALSDASIFNVKNQNSFTGNQNSSKDDSSDSEGSNAIKVLSNIRTKFAKNVI